MIVFSVWGDHAFFYKDTLGAQTLKVGNVSSIPEVKLAYRLEYERAPYRDMEEWCQEKSTLFKTFRTTRIDDAIHYLREAKMRIRVRYRTPTLVSSVSVRTRKGTYKIKSMPPAAELLNDIAEALNSRMPFDYCGEAEGAFATRFMERVLSK